MDSGSQPLMAELELNGQLVPMEINTGAAVTLMSRKTKQLLSKVVWSPLGSSLPSAVD